LTMSTQPLKQDATSRDALAGLFVDVMSVEWTEEWWNEGRIEKLEERYEDERDLTLSLAVVYDGTVVHVAIITQELSGYYTSCDYTSVAYSQFKAWFARLLRNSGGVVVSSLNAVRLVTESCDDLLADAPNVVLIGTLQKKGRDQDTPLVVWDRKAIPSGARPMDEVILVARNQLFIKVRGKMAFPRVYFWATQMRNFMAASQEGKLNQLAVAAQVLIDQSERTSDEGKAILAVAVSLSEEKVAPSAPESQDWVDVQLHGPRVATRRIFVPRGTDMPVTFPEATVASADYGPNCSDAAMGILYQPECGDNCTMVLNNLASHGVITNTNQEWVDGQWRCTLDSTFAVSRTRVICSAFGERKSVARSIAAAALIGRVFTQVPTSAVTGGP